MDPPPTPSIGPFRAKRPLNIYHPSPMGARGELCALCVSIPSLLVSPPIPCVCVCVCVYTRVHVLLCACMDVHTPDKPRAQLPSCSPQTIGVACSPEQPLGYLRCLAWLLPLLKGWACSPLGVLVPLKVQDWRTGWH